MKWRLTPLRASGAVVALVAVAVPWFSWLEHRSNSENLDRMLYSKGTALMESLLHGLENSLMADHELTLSLGARLADNARQALLSGSTGPALEASLRRMSQLNDLARIDLYNADGWLLATSDPAHARDSIPEQLAVVPAVWDYSTSFIDEPPEPGRPDTYNEIFATAVLAPDGRRAVACARAEALYDIRRRLGIGLILDDLSAVKGVSYAVLQDSLGIIAASSGVREIGSLAADPFFPIPPDEIRGRYKDYFGEEVYELAAQFQWAGESYGYLRVGISTAEVRSIAALDRKRFALGMALLGILLSVVGVLYLAGRRQLRLEQEHARIKGLSDSVLQSMSEAVIVLDDSSRVLLYNEACRGLCGVSSPEVEGRSLSELNPELAALIERHGLGWTDMAEVELRRPDRAAPVPLLLSTAPLWLEDSRYTIVILSDLTDRRRAEEMVLLSQKYKTMAEISAGVAHEIRNPLNAIAMNVQRLRLEFSPAEAERAEYDEFIGIVLAEVERLNRIVEQFLRLARFPEPRLRKASLPALIGETLDFLSPEVESHGVRLERTVGPAPEFLFDPDQVGQVLTNLIRNALDFLPTGGRIEVRGESTDSQYRVSVSDNGPGIPAPEAEKVFEPFYSTRPGGLGLGLAIVQRIITEHGGSIRLESPPAGGARFVFALPLRRE
ncbi:PAS domain-containing protein [bacterium]|nr:PAS domain-containing protein [bacterium]